MILMNTYDIINKAKQLADLQNSDYISYNENITLLNDVYSHLYQKSINAGDLIYLKSLILSNGDMGLNKVCYDLPCDFYQLYSVKEGDGIIEVPILRKPKDAANITKGYDIVNDKIVIYGSTLGTVKIEYFPNPKTLYLKNEDIFLEYSGEPVSYNDKMILVFEDNILTAYDRETGSYTKQWKLSTDAPEPEKISIEKVDSGENGFVCYFTANGKKKVLFAYWNTDGEITTDYDSKITKRYDEENGVFFEDKTFDNEIAATSYEGCYFSLQNNKEKIELIEYEVIDEEIGKELTRIETPFNKDVRLAYQSDGNIYFIDNGKLYIYDIYSCSFTKVKAPKSESFIDVGEMDLFNGYGYLVNKLGKGYFIKSCFENTELDYPNNFFFDYISYMIAIQYKNKQEADATYLRNAAAEAENQYYDTFKRDTNSCIRMNNIHGY